LGTTIAWKERFNADPGVVGRQATIDGHPFTIVGVAPKARLYAEARENEERYRVLVATLGEGVAIVDLSECFVFANPAAESVFGVSPGGLVGRNLADFLGEADLALSKSETRKRVQGMRSTYEIAVRRPDGETRQIQLIATPRLGKDRCVNGTLGIFRDVTELRRLQRSLEQERSLLLSLIDSLPDFVYLKDRDGRFILANKAQAALLGMRDPKELVELSLLHFERYDTRTYSNVALSFYRACG